MLKNFCVPLLNLRGKPVRIKDDGTERDMLLSDAAIAALQSHLEEDRGMSGRDQIALTSLSLRIVEGGEREYTTQELAKILDRTEKAGDKLWTFRMHEFIDPKPETPDKPE